MYGYSNPVSQYRQASRAASADDPHRVIALLFAGAIERTRTAEACLLRGDILGKIDAIGSAIRIVDGLNLSLDHSAGGEMAAGLQAIYQHSTLRLVQANAKNDPVLLQEVASLLTEIASAWMAISPTVVAAADKSEIAGEK